MTVYIGNNKLKKVYLGSTQIKKIFVGDNQVYGYYDPGIYHNNNLQLISISNNGYERYTLKDRNIGATTNDYTNSGSYGNYFQWGNNYGFNTSPSKSSTKPNASSYGPSTYSSSTFITTSNSVSDRSSATNNNLWGKQSGSRRGPCPEGFHVPDWDTEFYKIITIFQSLTTNNKANFQKYFKFPLAGRLEYTGYTGSRGTNAFRRMCAANTNTNGLIYGIENNTVKLAAFGKSMGMTVRPFKDTPVVPDGSRTKLL